MALPILEDEYSCSKVFGQVPVPLQPQPPLLTDAAAAAPRTHTYIHTVLVSQQQEKRARCRHPPLNRAEVRGGDVAALFSWQQTCERSRRGAIAGSPCHVSGQMLRPTTRRCSRECPS